MKVIDDDMFMSGPGDSDNAEFIPVLTIDDIHISRDDEVPEELPIMPLRNSVLYPGIVIPITVGRDTAHLFSCQNLPLPISMPLLPQCTPASLLTSSFKFQPILQGLAPIPLPP